MLLGWVAVRKSATTRTPEAALTDSEFEAAENWPLVDSAVEIIVRRRGSTRDEARLLLSDAAEEHDMSISEMALCIVVDREIPRHRPGLG